MLYKHTIVIWSELGQMDDLATIGGAADCGDAYCAKYEVDQVEDPSKDPDWDGTEFFGTGDEDDEDDEAQPNPLLAHLRDFEACQDSIDWVRSLPSGTTPVQAYSVCERGDWLVWLALRAGVDVLTVARSVCVCLRNALPLWQKCYPADARPVRALQDVESSLKGHAGIAILSSSYLESDSAARRARDDHRVLGDVSYLKASRVATAMAQAAQAMAGQNGHMASTLSLGLADALATAVDALSVCLPGETPPNAHKECADIVRAHISWPVMAAALGLDPT